MKPLYIIRGKVKTGAKRGKLLGFPTVNILLHKKVPEGIYVATVIIEKQEYQAATFVGPAKTFNEKEAKVESYILDFNKNIYGKWITVHLLKKLRGNKKFSSQEALIQKIHKDVALTRDFFRK